MADPRAAAAPSFPQLPRWVRAVRAGLGLAVVGFLVRHLAHNWDQVQAADLAWRIDWGILAAAVATLLATYAMLVEAWRRLASAWGWQLSRRHAARVWILSSMGKYLPGKFWAVAGLATYAREAGVSAWHATTSAVVNQMLSLASGAALAAAFGAGLGPAVPVRWVLGVGLVAGAATVALARRPEIVVRLLARAGLPSPFPPRLPCSAVLTAVALHLAGWLGHGAALLLVVRGTLPDVALSYEVAVAAFTISYIAGFVFLLAPGGIGVREGALVLMLQGAVGVAPALALAATSRIALTVADLLAATPFALIRRRVDAQS